MAGDDTSQRNLDQRLWDSSDGQLDRTKEVVVHEPPPHAPSNDNNPDSNKDSGDAMPKQQQKKDNPDYNITKPSSQQPRYTLDAYPDL